MKGALQDLTKIVLKTLLKKYTDTKYRDIVFSKIKGE